MTSATSLAVTLTLWMMSVAPGDGNSGLFSKEYCQNEVFTADCGQHDVILMSEAQYGLMEHSRCVKRDYGFIGCQNNVLDLADSYCSGRHSCNIRVPNGDLDAAQTGCPDDFKSYLKASYKCIQVVQASESRCRSEPHVLLEGIQGTIASVVTMDTGCGSTKAPWVIQARQGQHVEVSLVDFSSGSDQPHRSGSKCYAYATIKEAEVSRTETICGGKNRASVVYRSETNKVQIIVVSGSNNEESSRYFFLNYKVLGCPTPASPIGGWLSRHDNGLSYGCNDSAVTSQLSCNGSHWSGTVQNCSLGASAITFPGGAFSLFTMSYELAVVLIFAIALVVASIILCMGIVCMKRIRDHHRGELQYGTQLPAYTRTRDGQPMDLEYGPPKDVVNSNPSSHGNYNYEQYRNGENVYASIQDGPVMPGAGAKLPVADVTCTCPGREAVRDTAACATGPYSSLGYGVQGHFRSKTKMDADPGVLADDPDTCYGQGLEPATLESDRSQS